VRVRVRVRVRARVRVRVRVRVRARARARVRVRVSRLLAQPLALCDPAPWHERRPRRLECDVHALRALSVRAHLAEPVHLGRAVVAHQGGRGRLPLLQSEARSGLCGEPQRDDDVGTLGHTVGF
jgi:hypothetical protein